MKSLLAKNAEVLVTMDDKRRELKNAGLYAVDGAIKQVGPTEELPKTADVVVNLSGQIALPGLVNTHHHLNQTLVRNLPAAQSNNLFPWLRAQYRIWAGTTPEASRVSTLIGLAELALSGCTTVFDHSYIFKNGNTVDCQIEAAKEIGVRFHASRGSMSLGESKGGLPPDDCVEEEDFILRDSQRVIEQYHDASRGAMARIVLAPCSPFSVSSDLLKQTAALARSLKVMLHTHLCETFDEERYTLERFQLRPVDWMETVNWLADDVWFAHGSMWTRRKLGSSRTRAAASRTVPARICAWLPASPRSSNTWLQVSKSVLESTARPATIHPICCKRCAKRCYWPGCVWVCYHQRARESIPFFRSRTPCEPLNG